MIPKVVEKLIVEIAGNLSEKHRKRRKKEVKADPEKGLVGMLLSIKEELSGDHTTRITAMLSPTLEQGLYEGKLEEAERLLRRSHGRSVSHARRQRGRRQAAR